MGFTRRIWESCVPILTAILDVRPHFFTRMILIGPRLYLDHFDHVRVSTFSDASEKATERGRRTMVLPPRGRVDRDRRTPQTDLMSTLQDCRHTQPPRRSLRIRRQQPTTTNTPGTTHLLQQPSSKTRLRTNLQYLAHRQDPTSEHHHTHTADLCPARRRWHHRCGHQSCQLSSV